MYAVAQVIHGSVRAIQGVQADQGVHVGPQVGVAAAEPTTAGLDAARFYQPGGNAIAMPMRP
jgi:hypothetical protein